MILNHVIATVHRYRERVRTQAQLARDIQHLREVARMLFEDKPDKTKAVEAVNDIAAKRRARLDADARALLDSALSGPGGSGSRDHGDLLSALMLVNRAGQFPYTQGLIEPGASTGSAPDTAVRTPTLHGMPPRDRPDIDPVLPLASALIEGWAQRAATAQRDAGAGAVEAAPMAIEFDEHRDARHRALACAARRLWAVSLREHFGIAGDGLKLWLVPPGEPAATARPGQEISDRATDQAEDALLAAVQARIRLSEPD